MQFSTRPISLFFGFSVVFTLFFQILSPYHDDSFRSNTIFANAPQEDSPRKVVSPTAVSNGDGMISNHAEIPAVNGTSLSTSRQAENVAIESTVTIDETSTVLPKTNKPVAAGYVEKYISKYNPTRITTDVDAKDQNRKQRRPILYLHPGPPKTATSTMQNHMTMYRRLLAKDNIFYLGKSMPGEKWEFKFPHAAHCIIYGQYAESGKNIKRNCTTVMREQLNEYYRAGKDVILSDEVIGIMFDGREKPKQLGRSREGLNSFFRDVARSNNWDIRVLIGYRPYFDFTRSVFAQLHTGIVLGKVTMQRWPIKGKRGPKYGQAVPLLKDNLFHTNGWPTADELADLFAPYADTIHIFDITSPEPQGDFTVHFFCTLLQDAKDACANRIKFAARKDFRKNVAIPPDYDQIATAAADRGLVNTVRRQRLTVTKEIAKYMSLNGTEVTDLPRVCPTKENIEKLYNISLSQEMKLFPERSPNWEVKALFDEAIKQKKLCSVDVDKVLEDEEWRKFFETSFS